MFRFQPSISNIQIQPFQIKTTQMFTHEYKQTKL